MRVDHSRIWRSDAIAIEQNAAEKSRQKAIEILKDNSQLKVVDLGVAKTVGELKKLIENYPDETQFAFRNQPMQHLFEIQDDNFKCLAFQEC